MRLDLFLWNLKQAAKRNSGERVFEKDKTADNFSKILKLGFLIVFFLFIKQLIKNREIGLI